MAPGGLDLTVYTVQMIETMSLAAAVAKKDDNEHSLLVYRDHSNRG